MTTFVIDASLAASIFIQDEATPAANRAVARFRLAKRRLVPTHFFMEVANALLAAERRGRSSRSETLEAIEGLKIFPVTVDEETTSRCLEDTLNLAIALNLKMYDAAYLELAKRESAILATFDKALARAAREAGIVVLS